MYALNKKSWLNIRGEFQAHPVFSRFAHSLQSQRLWAIMGSIFILGLVIAVVTSMAMLALWVLKIDLSIFDPRPMLH